MKRAPIVIAGTLAGLIGVLEFHTTPVSLTIGGLPGSSAASAPASIGGAAGGSRASAGAGAAANASPAPGSASQPSGASHTAVGPGVNYYFGVISVKVKVSGNKIVNVAIASLNDSGNPRSQFIDQQAIPILEQEVIQAQSANIQGVSGASYTSAGFARSLQSALHSLGFA